MLSDEESLDFDSSDMLSFIQYTRKYAVIQPKTFWCEFPFYIIVESARQKYRLGKRPEALSGVDTIEQKVIRKHQSYLNRLERFPLEKAEYYQRLKEAHGVTTVRGLSQITGEDWSYIAKILRTLELPDSVKDFLKSNKNDPLIVKTFHLRRLIDIVQQKEERLQLARFREYVEEIF